MPQFERVQKRKHRRKDDTVPEVIAEGLGVRRAFGGGPDETDEILDAIDKALAEETTRSLGASGLKSD